MTSYEVQPDVCMAIFAQAEEAADRADEQHVSMSSEVDELRGLCSRGESAPIASGLSGVYNRLLDKGDDGGNPADQECCFRWSTSSWLYSAWRS